MQKCTVKVSDLGGLHLRNAARIVKSCKLYQCKVTVCHGDSCAEGCSILQMLALGAGRDSVIEIRTEGPDEELAIRQLAGFFSDGGGI